MSKGRSRRDLELNKYIEVVKARFLEIRIFEESTKKIVYNRQTEEAIANGEMCIRDRFIPHSQEIVIA